MSTSRTETESTSGWSQRLRRVGQQLALLASVVCALYLTVALTSHHPADYGQWQTAGEVSHNQGGIVGALYAETMLLIVGHGALLLALVPLLIGWRINVRSRLADPLLVECIRRTVGLLLALCGLAMLLAARVGDIAGLNEGPGGLVGSGLLSLTVAAVGFRFAVIAALAMTLLGMTLLLELHWLTLMDRIGAAVLWLYGRVQRWLSQGEAKAQTRRVRAEREAARKLDEQLLATKPAPRIEPPKAPVVRSSRTERERREVQMPLFDSLPSDGELPPLRLLDEAPPSAQNYSTEALEALSRQVEIKLKEFRVEARVVGVYPGPVITRFELELAPGIKGAQVSSLDKDIARGLSVQSVRVVEVIPGKSVIAIEIPNSRREIVYLSELLGSREYDRASSPLTLALGKDIAGAPVMVDVARMPHLLVAGTTGSGKSVAINAMILSLLYKARPEEVRLIMVDPKMLELSVYDGIAHLLTPVVTDMKEAANALRWCVVEMDRRYKLMAQVGVRNLAGYNRKVREAEQSGHPLPNPLAPPRPPLAEGQTPEPPELLSTLPFIVVLIDEFADMMMIVGKKVEELIARLAQKARAAGIHLILATQRPSVDVITGLIKANIPTRIGFQVSSKIDSRTILDQSGAEQLLGHGDMLYLPPGSGLPERVHGAFVSDEEVHRVVAWLRQQGEPNYRDDVLADVQLLESGQTLGATGLPEDIAVAGDGDALYDEAVRFVIESRKASISAVQRKLKIGYNRAARMIEEMEASGLVSPPAHNGNREVLVPAPVRDY